MLVVTTNRWQQKQTLDLVYQLTGEIFSFPTAHIWSTIIQNKRYKLFVASIMASVRWREYENFIEPSIVIYIVCLHDSPLELVLESCQYGNSNSWWTSDRQNVAHRNWNSPLDHCTVIANHPQPSVMQQSVTRPATNSLRAAALRHPRTLHSIPPSYLTCELECIFFFFLFCAARTCFFSVCYF